MRALLQHRIQPPASEGLTRGLLHSASRPATAAARTGIGNQALQRLIKTGGLQPKLTISQAGDQFEQETEELDLFAGASADFSLSSPIRIFYVESLASTDRAYSIPPYCATGAAASLSGMAAVSNSGMPRSLAHELGHILFNSADHHLADTNNLMHPTNTSTGEQIDQATQCSTI